MQVPVFPRAAPSSSRVRPSRPRVWRGLRHLARAAAVGLRVCAPTFCWCPRRTWQSAVEPAATTTSCLGGVEGALPDVPPPHTIIRCDRRCCTLPRAHRSSQARSRDPRNGFRHGLLCSCGESTVLEVLALAALAADRKTRLLATTPLPARPRLSNYLRKFVRRRPLGGVFS